MILPEKKTIESLLTESGYKFSVPTYQRSFDWGIGELEDLIGDLKDIKETKDRELFLGTFIFDVSKGTDFKIVDGQ